MVVALPDIPELGVLVDKSEGRNVGVGVRVGVEWFELGKGDGLLDGGVRDGAVEGRSTTDGSEEGIEVCNSTTGNFVDAVGRMVKEEEGSDVDVREDDVLGGTEGIDDVGRAVRRCIKW